MAKRSASPIAWSVKFQHQTQREQRERASRLAGGEYLDTPWYEVKMQENSISAPKLSQLGKNRPMITREKTQEFMDLKYEPNFEKLHHLPSGYIEFGKFSDGPQKGSFRNVKKTVEFFTKTIPNHDHKYRRLDPSCPVFSKQTSRSQREKVGVRNGIPQQSASTFPLKIKYDVVDARQRGVFISPEPVRKLPPAVLRSRTASPTLAAAGKEAGKAGETHPLPAAEAAPPEDPIPRGGDGPAPTHTPTGSKGKLGSRPSTPLSPLSPLSGKSHPTDAPLDSPQGDGGGGKRRKLPASLLPLLVGEGEEDSPSGSPTPLEELDAALNDLPQALQTPRKKKKERPHHESSGAFTSPSKQALPHAGTPKAASPKAAASPKGGLPEAQESPTAKRPSSGLPPSSYHLIENRITGAVTMNKQLGRGIKPKTRFYVQHFPEIRNDPVS